MSSRLSPKNNPLAPKSRVPRAAFTLIELLMCLVILALLMAILFVAMAPVRARGSQTRCLTNLRQIGLALQMYRQDYGGGDPPKALLATDLGLPPGPFPISVYLNSYIKSAPGTGNIFWCEIGDDHSSPNPHIVADSNYWHPFLRAEDLNIPTPKFSEQVKGFGEDVVVLADPYHTRYGSQYNKNDPTVPIPLMTMSLDGRATLKMMSLDDLNRAHP